jgi:hypothetical protein
LRAIYWDEIIREAGRETLDAARRHRRYAMVTALGLLAGVLAMQAALGGGGRAGNLLATIAWAAAVSALAGALFVWKLISIPPRRHGVQQREIDRLKQKLQRAGDPEPATART